MNYDFRGRINERFHQTLEHYMKEIDYPKPKSPRILNLGCGSCPEAEILVDFFEGSILGIDINKRVIKSLRRKYKKNDDYEFIHGDARSLSDLVDGKVEIVVARHPDVNNDDWDTIFRESYKVTKKGGIVIATCVFGSEPEITKKNLKKANYKVKICEENIFPLIKGPGPMWNDKYVIVGKK